MSRGLSQSLLHLFSICYGRHAANSFSFFRLSARLLLGLAAGSFHWLKKNLNPAKISQENKGLVWRCKHQKSPLSLLMSQIRAFLTTSLRCTIDHYHVNSSTTWLHAMNFVWDKCLSEHFSKIYSINLIIRHHF